MRKAVVLDRNELVHAIENEQAKEVKKRRSGRKSSCIRGFRTLKNVSD